MCVFTGLLAEMESDVKTGPSLKFTWLFLIFDLNSQLYQHD